MKQNVLLRLSKREKYIVYIAAVAIMAIFFDRVIVRPVVQRLAELNRELDVQQKMLQRTTQVLSQESSITEEHDKLVQALKKDGFDEEEVAALLSEIEQLASEAGVFLANIKPRLTEGTEHYKRYMVEVDLESKMTELVDFIYQLEKSPSLLRVEEFYLVPKKKGSDVLKTRMVISEVLIVNEHIIYEPEG